VQREAKTRAEILTEAAAGSCVCDGRWLGLADALCRKNGIDPKLLQAALYRALTDDAGEEHRGNAVCLRGATTAGKTFVTSPIGDIYVCHFAVAKDCRFPLVGAGEPSAGRGLAASAKFPEQKTVELRLLTDEIFARRPLLVLA
jgi:hypothetical protein